MRTIWKELEINDRKVKVSNEGEIQLLHKTFGWWFTLSQIEYGTNHYKYVRIDNVNYAVHRLVAHTFIDRNLPLQNKRKPNDGNEKKFVEHIDCDVNNNRLSNLRITTQKENCNNLISKTRYQKSNSRLRMGNKAIKATNIADEDIDANELYFYNWKQVADFLNMPKENAKSNVLYSNKVSKQYKGYMWEFVKDATYVPREKTKYYWKKKERETNNYKPLETKNKDNYLTIDDYNVLPEELQNLIGY